MTDPPGSWRPAVPKKPVDVKIPPPNATSRKPSNEASAALRGATQAFGLSHHPKVERAYATDHTGARVAAVLAGEHSRPASAPRPNGVANNGADSPRGRQMNHNPIAAARDALRTRSQNIKFSPERSLPVRSPSAVAARLASTNSSPTRGPVEDSIQRNYALYRPKPPSPAQSSSAITSSPERITDDSPSRDGAKIVLAKTINSPASIASRSALTLKPPTRAPIVERTEPTKQAQSPAKQSAPAPVVAQLAAKHVLPDASTSQSSVKSPPSSQLSAKRSLSTVLLSDSEPPLRPLSSGSDGAEDLFREPLSIEEPRSPPSQSIPRSRPIPLPPARGKPISKSSVSSTGGHSKDSHIGMTQNTLADAIVASSLASSRAGSPTRLDRPPVPLRRSRSHSWLSRHHSEPLQEPVSPPKPMKPMKPMRHTLRKQSKPEDDAAEIAIVKRGRRHHFRKHPHKHHEGDRKRWRDKVTERERRRYEGLWAANRGLFLFWDSPEAPFGVTHRPFAPEADMVVNVVVREIWERSRLPKDVLEEVWDLVASDDEAKALKRDEFVVGLWLIDQRLKGRKLPGRVSDSVWASVRHTQGLKLSRRPY